MMRGEIGWYRRERERERERERAITSEWGKENHGSAMLQKLAASEVYPIYYKFTDEPIDFQAPLFSTSNTLSTL
jgi:hypothetical protein